MIQRLLMLTMLFLAPSLCLAQQSLAGSYKLVSLRITVDGQPAPAMENPSGLLVMTPKVYLHGFAGANRKFGTSTEEKAALWDTLNFYVDGALQQKWSGDTGWQTWHFGLSEGPHTLEFRYVKDSNGSAGLDAAFVDDFRLPLSVALTLPRSAPRGRRGRVRSCGTVSG